MKITPLGSGAIDAYNKQNNSNKDLHKNADLKDQDRAEISSRGWEMQSYLSKLKEIPDIRQDKVEDLKTRINNGTYTASAEKIAEGMIRHSRVDEKI